MNNQTVIDTVVKYSKDCIIKRFIKEHLKKSWMLAKSQNLPSANTLKIVIDELDFRINALMFQMKKDQLLLGIDL